MEKIKRDAFLYLAPSDTDDEFAQCVDCALYLEHEKRCIIHGPDLEVSPDASCGFYVHGHDAITKDIPPALVTPKESGLVHREVRCENCFFFNKPKRCGLFDKLNASNPDIFALDAIVQPQACCNAQTPKRKTPR